jgi:hypothetical protein
MGKGGGKGGGKGKGKGGNGTPSQRPLADISASLLQAPYRKVSRSLRIRGDHIDISDFKHPGGDVITHYGEGQDATDAFETFHNRSEAAQKILRVLPRVQATSSIGSKGSERNPYAGTDAEIHRAGQLIDRDVERLRDDLRTEGLFDLHTYPLLHFLVAYFLHDVVLYALSLTLVFNGWLATGMMMRSFAHVQRGGTMHDVRAP